MAINRIRADIDLDAILYNMESMHNKLKPGTMMAAVVKADGYGHGAEAVSEVLEPLPYLWGYAVATSNEAMQLIAAGRKKPILILGLSFPEQFEEIVDNDVRPAVCTYETAKELSRIAASKNKTCKIHIKIDTGMCRIGFQVTEESADIIAQIAKLPNIMIEGMFTHFARADELSKEPAFEQFELFKRMIALVEARGVEIAIKHCSNSLCAGTMMAAVVKADGYGHGAEAVSEVLEPLPYLWGYAVAIPQLPDRLINASPSAAAIIVRKSLSTQTTLYKLANSPATPMISSCI